jgi:hypothetical protein
MPLFLTTRQNTHPHRPKTLEERNTLNGNITL